MSSPAYSRRATFRFSEFGLRKVRTQGLVAGSGLLLSPLLGAGAYGQAALAPARLAFGNQAVGQASPAQTVTLENRQSAPLRIARITISGGTAPSDFAAGGDCPVSPQSLGAGKRCRITVTFTPAAPGLRTATLMVVPVDGDAGESPSIPARIAAIKDRGNDPAPRDRRDGAEG